MAAGTADALVVEHMPLVGHLVRSMMGRVPAQVSRDDLMSAGYLALVQAAQAFKEEHGVPFSSYAGFRIKGALVDELRSVDWASRSVRRRARELDSARQRLTVELRRAPTNEELAGATGLTAPEVAAVAEDLARADTISLEGPAGDMLVDVLASDRPGPQAALEHREQLSLMVQAVDQLPDRLRTVVVDFYLLQRPMAETAETLGVTESRISQMRAEGLVLMRAAMGQILEVGSATQTGRSSRKTASYVAAVAARHAATLRRQAHGAVISEATA